MTTASMPKGTEKNTVESSAASAKTPAGDAKTPISHRVSECT